MIRRLPRDVIDRIAAGEVVERPASVVKELVENCLDARASEISVTIEGGGLGLIRIADNGIGMSAEELPLAFAAHATSKLVDVDDLFHIVSFGFRGEALASIGAVSHCRIVSATGDDGLGHRLDCDGGEVGEVIPAPSRRGTVIEVRDLFYNTPARRRFLGAMTTEAAKCREVCTALALVNPGVRIRCEVDGKLRFAGTGAQGLRDRIAEVNGAEFAEQLVPVHGEGPGMTLDGFITLPSAARPRPRTQQIFVNDRLVKDRSVISAVRTACRDFLPPSLQAAFVLSLTIDPQQVDVNVHPTKAEVRFRERDALFRLVRRACRDAYLAQDLSPRLRAEHVAEASAAAALPFGAPTAPPPSEHQRPAGPSAGGAEPPAAYPSPRAPAPASPPDVATDTPLINGPARGPTFRAAERFVQVLDTYLLHACAEGMVIVDQHALHERVLYARLQDQRAAGKLERQRLLVPVPVRLDPSEHARCLESLDELAAQGLEVAEFGPDTVAIHAIPAVLRQEKLDDLLRAVLDPPDLHGGIPDGLDRRLFTIACHAAVKAGDRLSEAEAQELLELGAALEHDSTCPHGRPTRLVVGRTELERLFKRSGF